MKYLDYDPIAEIHRNRELLLEKFGDIEGLLKHLEEIRPELIKQGWTFISDKELAALNKKERNEE